ncbi:hypothetical protein EOD42_04690 [Rhodovarius crocodyli]|uniref:PepSY domain-containing protein n=2 Tax=Rhodovarius crocodyli TaxID=1979269 RepID=A0A437MP48_9PROT|nr:hypothetical protein EOD42_04690 [Rhodovarius crocodyli]
MRRMLTIAGMGTLLLLGATHLAPAADDHERARRAFEAGEIRSLAEILTTVEERYLGRVIEAELEREDGIWQYEIKVQPPTGRPYKVEVNATTGEILRASGQAQERPR